MHFQTGCINKFLIPDQGFKSSISTCFTLACFFFCSVCSCVRYNRLQIHHACFVWVWLFVCWCEWSSDSGENEENNKKIVEGSHNFQDFSFKSVKFVVFSSNTAEGVGYFVSSKVQGVGLVWDHACTIHGLLRLLYRSVFRQF